ncbi:hypothetical protein GCM10007897_41610 [Sphingobium jiangsuense]|nr:hypothetical protein GCM10007897_41610 [Sphingobium jiangsuense]
MSNSRRKNPIIGITTAESDKPFKQAEHRRERAAVKIAIQQGKEPPHPREFGDPWHGEKDGKLYQPGRPNVLRK